MPTGPPPSKAHVIEAQGSASAVVTRMPSGANASDKMALPHHTPRDREHSASCEDFELTKLSNISDAIRNKQDVSVGPGS